jgi:hypothetical protein
MKSEVVSPKDTAQGRGDAFLIGLNAAIAEFGARSLSPAARDEQLPPAVQRVEANGRARGADHTTAAFRKAPHGSRSCGGHRVR